MKEVTFNEFARDPALWIESAQKEPILIIREDRPVAVVVGTERKDKGDWLLEISPEFWRMIEKRRDVLVTSLEEVKPDLIREQRISNSRFALTFPELICTRLKYVDEMMPEDYQVVTVDGLKLVRWYFENATSGREYEIASNREENFQTRNMLTQADFDNILNIGGRGWIKNKEERYAYVEHLLGKSFLDLEAIPVDADLFQSSDYDSTAVRLLESLLGVKGVSVANASKLLYQKRKRLIPIFDELVRRALNVPYLHDDVHRRKAQGRNCQSRSNAGFAALKNMASWFTDEPDLGAFGIGFRQFRYVSSFENNASALDSISEAIEADPELTAHTPLSRVRLLDIIAWSTIQKMPDLLKAQGAKQ